MSCNVLPAVLAQNSIVILSWVSFETDLDGNQVRHQQHLNLGRFGVHSLVQRVSGGSVPGTVLGSRDAENKGCV